MKQKKMLIDLVKLSFSTSSKVRLNVEYANRAKMYNMHIIFQAISKFKLS